MSEIRQLIADERHELATLLKDLTPDQWDAPSLCEGWRVHEVVAHLTAPYRHSTARIVLELIKSRGRMNPMLDRLARRDASDYTATELADCLAANVNHPWKPPGDGFEAALSHDVIHGLDITVALGIDRRVPVERVRVVLAGMNTKTLKFFNVDLTDIQLRATDLDWSYGSGSQVISAPAQELLLKVCGRRP